MRKILTTLLMAAMLLPAGAVTPRDARSLMRQREKTTRAPRQQSRQVQAASAASDDVTFIGSLIYGWYLPDGDEGLYTFGYPSKKLTALQKSPLLNACGSGTLIDGKYYCSTLDAINGQYVVYNSVYDIYENRIVYSEPGDFNTAAADMAYDPVSGYVYGCFATVRDDEYAHCFGKLDVRTWKTTEIAPLTGFWYGMACDKDGNLFGVDEDGRFCRVDKNDGTPYVIGFTGVYPEYQSSLTIHPVTGVFYWMMSVGDDAYLYTINPTTGKGTKVYTFPEGEQLVGIDILLPEAEDGAPAVLTSLDVRPQTDTRTVDFSAELPVTTFDGKSATGDCTLVVMDGSKEVFRSATQFGATVSGSFTVESDGMHDFIAYAVNSVGEGPKLKVKKWVGLDTPAAPANVKAEHSGTKFTITWNPVVIGANGGYIDASQVTYTLQNASGAQIATGITGTSATSNAFDLGTLADYTFRVTATSGNLTSEPGVSNRVILGSASLPYSNNFASEDDSKYFTIVDANGDGHSWDFYFDRMRCHAEGDAKLDDWLMTPPVNLTEGKYYEFSAELWAVDSDSEEHFSIAVGTEPTAEGMSTVLLPRTLLCQDVNQKYTVGFTAPATGRYYFGVRGMSECYMPIIYLDNVSISAAAAADVPAAVGELEVKPFALGDLGADLSFKAPATDMKGAALNSNLTKITINRDGKQVASIEDVKPGASVTYQDTGMLHGNHRYTVTAWKGTRSGNPAEATVYVGAHAPELPSAFTGTFTQKEGEVKLSWEAPEYDVTGAAIGADKVYYTILANVDNKLVTVATNIQGTEYTYQASQPGESQRFILYALYAATAGGEAETYVLSNLTPVGGSYITPFTESFADGELTNVFSSDVDTNFAKWELCQDDGVSGVNSMNGDNGYLNLKASKLAKPQSFIGSSSSMSTAKINVKGENPVAELWYYAEEAGDCNEIELLVTDGTAWKSVAKTATAEKKGWNRLMGSLKEYDGKTVQIKFSVLPVKSLNTPIDNVRVIDDAGVNLSVNLLSAPEAAKPGDMLIFKFNISNSGSSEVAQEDYTLGVYRNDTRVETLSFGNLVVGRSIDFEWSEAVTVAATEEARYYAMVECEADEIAADNKSDTKTVKVKISGYVRPENLRNTSTDESKVRLEWDQVVGETPVAVTEDFESYDSWATQDVGDWKIVDKDGLLSRQVLSTYPMKAIEGIPLAFAVYDMSDPSQHPDDPDRLGSWTPRSGNKAMITLPNEELLSVADEWLITPVLSGEAQTVKFYAKGTSNIWVQSFEVLYSDLDNDPNSFELLKRYDDVKGYMNFNEYAVDLPAGANYMAIRHVARDGETPYIFMVDDVTYVPGKRTVHDLIGYNVYRDGRKLNDAPVQTPLFEEAAQPGRHLYTVSALYLKGESGVSNEVAIGTSGVGTTVYDSGGAVVMLLGDMVVVECAGDVRVDIVAMDGRSVHVGQGPLRLRLAPGLYAVKAGTRTLKLLVK